MTYLFIVLIKYQINNYPQHPTDSMKGQQAITLRAALPQRGLIGVLAPFHYASVTLPGCRAASYSYGWKNSGVNGRAVGTR